jgi:hypothetical protein
MSKPILVIDLPPNLNDEDVKNAHRTLLKDTGNEYHLILRRVPNSTNIFCINPDNVFNNIDVQKLIEALKK